MSSTRSSSLHSARTSGWPRSRHYRRWLSFSSVLVASSLAMVSLVPPAGAAGPTQPTTAGNLAITRQQVSAIEQQLTADQSALETSDEMYNELSIKVQSTRSNLQAVRAALARQNVLYGRHRHHLSHAVVATYEQGSAASGLATVFSQPTASSQITKVLRNVGVGRLNGQLHQFQVTTARLEAEQRRLTAVQTSLQKQLSQAAQLRQKAGTLAAQTQATLAGLQGQEAQEVAQIAAQQAATAAAAAAAARSKAAAQAAAQAAARAASVASTVAPGSPSATKASGSATQASTSAGNPQAGSSGSTNPAGALAVKTAMSFLGTPYVWGGASYHGVDCSGLTMLSWAAAGVRLDHSAADQYAMSTKVSLSQLEPGDLLFFNNGGSSIEHVVMYVGATYNGRPTPYGVNTIIQAAHTGTNVELSSLWTEGLAGAARP